VRAFWISEDNLSLFQVIKNDLTVEMIAWFWWRFDWEKKMAVCRISINQSNYNA